MTAFTESLPILGQCHWGTLSKPHNHPHPLQLANLIHLHSARYQTHQMNHIIPSKKIDILTVEI